MTAMSPTRPTPLPTQTIPDATCRNWTMTRSMCGLLNCSQRRRKQWLTTAGSLPARIQHPAELTLEVGYLVADAGCVLEPQIGGGFVHLVRQRLDELGEFFLRE